MSMRQLVISPTITNRESDGIVKYLQEISKEPRISPEEEVVLAGRIKKGDRQALQALIKANLRFVVSVAKQYQGKGLSLSDLVNEGNIGLMEAAQRYDPSRGFKFISFAVWWIRQHILQAIAANGRTIRMPLNKLALSNRAHRAASLLEQQLERRPAPEEIAASMDVDPEELSKAMEHRVPLLSLDSPLEGDGEESYLDILENKEAADPREKLMHHDSLKKEISKLLGTLPRRYREVLCFQFGIGMDHPLSLEEIARRYDLTTERVRQIREKALDQLRSVVKLDSLRSFLRA